MRPRCNICYGRGIHKDKKTGRYYRCVCGRLPDSSGVAKLVKQEKLDSRLEEVKKGGW
jgi:hypothetical protein